MIQTPNGIVLTIDQAIQKLDTEVCFIEFEKADKTIREMCATRNLGFIPEKDLPKGSGRKQSDKVVTVYDLDIGAWRSFSKDRLKTLG